MLPQEDGLLLGLQKVGAWSLWPELGVFALNSLGFVATHQP
jgi:hypothetical protein